MYTGTRPCAPGILIVMGMGIGSVGLAFSEVSNWRQGDYRDRDSAIIAVPFTL